MVIGKGMAVNVQADRSQVVEEALWFSDARDSVQLQTRQFGSSASNASIIESTKHAALEAHAKVGWPGPIVTDHGIDRGQSRPGLTQRPRRQQKTIPEAAPIDDGNFDIASQRIVLQTIIAKYDVAVALGKECLCRGRPLPAHEHGTVAAPANQQGLIADFGGAIIVVNPVHVLIVAAIAAADDAGTLAEFPQALRQPDDQRRLARSADGNAADHHHRYR